MPTKRAVAILCCLLICLLILASTGCGSEESKQTPEQTLTPVLTAALPSESFVTVSIEPQQLAAKAGESVQLTVRVTPGAYGLSGGEINVRFDPQALNIVGLESGQLFGGNPLGGAKNIDSQAGTLKYA